MHATLSVRTFKMLQVNLSPVEQELAEWNAKYEDKFGHVFIICASGQPANQMLAAIKARHAPVGACIMQSFNRVFLD